MFLRIFLCIATLFTSSVCMALDDATSFFSQGKEAFNSGNYDKAFSCFSKAADLGNAEAQCYIGICYTVFAFAVFSIK